MKWTIDKGSLPFFVRIDTRGEPTVRDLAAMWSEVIESDFWKPGFTALLDNRKLNVARDPNEFVSGAIAFFSENKERIGPACIASVGVNPVSFQHARRFQHGIRFKGSDAVLQIFNTEPQAVQWLDHFCKTGKNSYHNEKAASWS